MKVFFLQLTVFIFFTPLLQAGSTCDDAKSVKVSDFTKVSNTITCKVRETYDISDYRKKGNTWTRYDYAEKDLTLWLKGTCLSWAGELKFGEGIFPAYKIMLTHTISKGYEASADHKISVKVVKKEDWGGEYTSLKEDKYRLGDQFSSHPFSRPNEPIFVFENDQYELKTLATKAKITMPDKFQKISDSQGYEKNFFSFLDTLSAKKLITPRVLNSVVVHCDEPIFEK